MPSNRKVVFANNEYYHVFNRGVEKRPTFTNKYEFLRAMNTLSFYRFAQLPIRYSKYLNLNETPRIPLRFTRGISSFTSLRSDGFANKLHPRATPAVLRLKE